MNIIRPKILYPLFSDLTTVNGIGPKTANILEKKIGKHLIDLLFYLPHSVIRRLNNLQLKNYPSQSIITKNIIIKKHINGYYRSRKPYKIIGLCEGIGVEILFFNFRSEYLKKNFPENTEVLISGKIEWDNEKVKIIHPDYIVNPKDNYKIPKFETVYPLTKGITNKLIRKCIKTTLDKIPNNFPEWIPQSLIYKKNWLTFKKSLQYIHLPQNENEMNLRDNCFERLGFDEVYANQLGLSIYREANKSNLVINNNNQYFYFESILKKLSFKLTNAQIKCIEKINLDIKSKSQMKRLLQGDVGSGKTLVALSAILTLVENNKQAVLMAPTDLLCVQHYEFIKNITSHLKINVSLLTSKVKKIDKKEVYKSISNGETKIIIGTHSLISDTLKFSNLGIAVIDEQHKFGVRQRNKILSKGINVHLLLLTATPIPRSLTMTHYGDLDLSILNEIPKNRKSIITKAIPIERHNEVIEAIEKALNRGEKIYWICPLLESSETLDIVALKKRYEELSKKFKKFNPVMAHGKMLKEEREKSVNKFFSNKSKILVATTVIEVGIDIPDATIIIIENSERFGLSQLHQLRGRVGRGSLQSFCILMYDKKISEIGKSRLQTIRASNDGFHIAEKDLELRGPGEIFGTNQSGEEDFRLFSLKNIEILETARLLSKKNTIGNNISSADKLLMSIFNRDEYIQTLN